MVQRLKHIRIPSSYTKMQLPQDDESRRRMMADHDGRLVLLSDSHYCPSNGYLFARLRIDPDDKECYYAQRINQSGVINETRMWFHDLTGLLVQDFQVLFSHDF